MTKISAILGPGGGFFGVGTSELVVIGAVAWLVLGPKRLYQLAKDIGKISGEIKNVAEEAKQTFQQAVDLESVDNKNQPSYKASKNTRERKIEALAPKKGESLDDLILNEIEELESKKKEN